jgi:hypothetical protein
MQEDVVTRKEFVIVSTVKVGLIFCCLCAITANNYISSNTNRVIREHIEDTRVKVALEEIMSAISDKCAIQSQTEIQCATR